MTMAPLPSLIELVAINEARNIRRQYSIVMSRDLFGATLVETRWGRIGRRGRLATHVFEQEADALAFVRRTLSRRATAETRIGVPYVPLHPFNPSDSISKC